MAEAMLQRMNLIEDADLEATRTLVKQQLPWKTGDRMLKMWLDKACSLKIMFGLEAFQIFLLQGDYVNASPKFESFKHNCQEKDSAF